MYYSLYGGVVGLLRAEKGSTTQVMCARFCSELVRIPVHDEQLSVTSRDQAPSIVQTEMLFASTRLGCRVFQYDDI